MDEVDPIIKELERAGVTLNDPRSSTGEGLRALGDVVEVVLNKFGITEDRFKWFFALSECDCSKRKEWLNSIMSWKKG